MLRWLMATLPALVSLASPSWAEDPAPSWQPGQVFRDCPTCPEMVVIPAGEFDMGKGDEEEARREDAVPLHRESIPHPFAIGKFEVTVAEFARFVAEASHRSDFPCHIQGIGVDHDDPNTWRNPGFERYDPWFWQQPTHPVVCVSYADAVAFTEWLSKRTGHSYRLPGESEWEYAYRAGTTSAYYWGDEPSRAQANYGRTESVDEEAAPSHFTAPVGSFPPNPFGLYDMAGNAAEWVDECDMEGDSDTPCLAWVSRGGSWDSWYSQLEGTRRTPSPHGMRPPSTWNDIGFRVVRDIFPRAERAEVPLPPPDEDDAASARDNTADERREVQRQQSETRLKQSYQSVILKTPADQRSPLEAAQRAWAAYRDAQCAWQTHDLAADCLAEMNMARAALLEDAVRLKEAGMGSPVAWSVRHGKLGHLSQFAGSFRHDAVLRDPEVARAVEDLTGKEGAKLIQRDMKDAALIELRGTVLVLRGHQAHLGMEQEALVLIDLEDGTIRAAVIDSEKSTIYARDEKYSWIPGALRYFARWPTIPEEQREHSPPEETGPPEGVTWVR